MSDLSERLVAVAAEKIWSLIAKEQGEHRDVVVAVLRELAAAEKTFGVGTLEDLADEIEEKQ